MPVNTTLGSSTNLAAHPASSAVRRSGSLREGRFIKSGCAWIRTEVLKAEARILYASRPCLGILMLTFAIGDVHGCLNKLTELLAKCRSFANGRQSRFLYVGDLVDRGPDSAAVVQTVMDMQLANSAGVIVLCGNHEEMLLNAHKHDAGAEWLVNGGSATLRSYGVAAPSLIPSDHLTWLEGLPDHYDDGQRFFVHAGIRPGVPLHQQRRDDLLWVREPFLSSALDHGRLIVHGHTPLRDGRPDIRANRINLDTGAVYGRPLTAAVFVETTAQPVGILQTPSLPPYARHNA
jgi:serine/threonine protein phosphatase 1